jgi:hypothetical protein
MKRPLLLFSVLIPLLSGTLHAQTLYRTEQQKARFLQDYCKRYYPDGSQVLAYEAESLDYTEYADGTTEAQMIESLSTVIHETYHAYENDFCDGDWDCVGYYLGDGIGFSAPVTEVFKTPLMDPYLPDSLKTEEFNSRYDPYIVGDLEITAHTQGIYGILEEMNAYYLGFEVGLSTWDYHLAKGKGKVSREMGETFFWQCGSDLLARYQFRYFVAWYLEHSQKKYPAVYKGIMANQRVRLAYTLLEQRYELAEQEYDGRLAEYIRMADAQGMEVSVDGDFLYFHNGNGYSGTGIFGEEIDRLDRGLLPKWRKQLEDFKLKGVTEQNWKSFL